MFPFVLPFLFFFLYHQVFIPTSATEKPYKPTDYFLINCGSSSNTPSISGDRSWDTDAHLNFLPPNMNEISTAASASKQDLSVDQVPYMSARIFHSKFTYSFPTSPGPKFLRLYFYPVTYSSSSAALLNTTDSFFTVTANGYTLLSNFSAFLTASAAPTDPRKPQPFIIKEFIVNVKDNQILNLTFSPSSNSHYSFVNGIEIISMPNNLYLRDDDRPIIKNVDENNKFQIDVNNSAFETLFRLNVGSGYVGDVNDTGMFRQWFADDDFLHGSYIGNPVILPEEIPLNYTKIQNYTAPREVYTTARAMGLLAIKSQLIWRFPVDSGFQYLLRLHFCEINPKEIYTQNQRVFSININNKTAEPQFDVMYQSGGSEIPIFRDYVVGVPLHPGRPAKQDIWLALFPNMAGKPQHADAILNGLEIFKMNGSDGNLAGPNPELPDPVVIPSNSPTSNHSNGRKRNSTTVYAIIGGVIGAAALLLSIMAFLIYRRRKRSKDTETSAGNKSSWGPLSVISSKSTKTTGSTLTLPSDLCRSFLLEELKSTTADFHDNFVIGRGGFGKVYKGYIDPTGETHVSTVVKGSLGYVDPEYFKRQQLTVKSDVYSFGMVLLEVLCARAAIIPTAPKEQVNLAVWARRNYINGNLDREIIDSSLKDEIAPECLRSYADIAFRCLKERGNERPAMNDVVWSLEFTLQLQEAADKINGEKPPQYSLLFGGGYDQLSVTTADKDNDSELFSGSGESAAKSKGSAADTSSSSERLKTETVFSEMMNSAGR